MLLRHAKSSWEEPGLADHDRPLAPRGRRACKLVAAHLSSEGIRPDLVLCSPARRTRETLERIAPALGEQAEVLIEDALYGASHRALLERLRGLADAVGTALLIGHNPAIQDLTLELAGDGSEIAGVRSKYPTAALATLEHLGSWRELQPGCAALVAFVRPKELARRGR
jgi:phosphohistidine phosphatase